MQTKWGDIVWLDMRHLGEKLINERLPLVRDLSISYVAADPVTDLVPVRPVVHYMMGGIHTDINAATPIAGLYAAGECACVSINGANRLGSNSLGELLVFGARAGRFAVEHVEDGEGAARRAGRPRQAADAEGRIKALFKRTGGKQRVAHAEARDEPRAGGGLRHLPRREVAAGDLSPSLPTSRARYTRRGARGQELGLQHRPLSDA